MNAHTQLDAKHHSMCAPIFPGVFYVLEMFQVDILREKSPFIHNTGPAL